MQDEVEMIEILDDIDSFQREMEDLHRQVIDVLSPVLGLENRAEPVPIEVVEYHDGDGEYKPSKKRIIIGLNAWYTQKNEEIKRVWEFDRQHVCVHETSHYLHHLRNPKIWSPSSEQEWISGIQTMKSELRELVADVLSLEFFNRTDQLQELSTYQDKIHYFRRMGTYLRDIYEKYHLLSNLATLSVEDKETGRILECVHQIRDKSLIKWGRK